MAKERCRDFKKIFRETRRKQNDEVLRAINHFEKVIRGEITLDDFVKERGGYGLKTRVKMPIGEVVYNDPKEHEYINGLMDMAINNHAKYCYVRFISKYTKPFIKKNDLYNKEADLKSDYVIYKYGLFVYFLDDGKMYKFIFAPYVDECELWMTHFALIDIDRNYNYIKIDKPIIKKDLKNRRKMPTRYLMVSLGNGMQASIPDYGPEDKMN